MYKDYPAQRVCAIDFYPLFLEALKESYHICKKYNIPFRTEGKGSRDVQKFFFHYCLEKFCTGYKNTKSKYPKCIVVYPLPKDVFFNDKSLTQILKVLPVPWCKVSSFESPDTEMACLRAINQNKQRDQRLNSFAHKHELVQFLKNSKKTKLFLNGALDLSGLTD